MRVVELKNPRYSPSECPRCGENWIEYDGIYEDNSLIKGKTFTVYGTVLECCCGYSNAIWKPRGLLELCQRLPSGHAVEFRDGAWRPCNPDTVISGAAIDAGVKRILREYGEALDRLADE